MQWVSCPQKGHGARCVLFYGEGGGWIEFLENVVVKRVRGWLLTGRGWQVEVDSSEFLNEENMKGSDYARRDGDSGFLSNDTPSSSSNSGTKTSRPSFAQDVIKEAHGVQCEWKMRPMYANKSQLRLARKVLGFHEDASINNGIILVQNREEEEFVHYLAATLLLGKVSIRRCLQPMRRSTTSYSQVDQLLYARTRVLSDNLLLAARGIGIIAQAKWNHVPLLSQVPQDAPNSGKRLDTPVEIEVPLSRPRTMDSLESDSDVDNMKDGETLDRYYMFVKCHETLPYFDRQAILRLLRAIMETSVLSR